MKEWLIELGKTVYYLGWFTTINGQPLQDFQYYGIGLYLFVFWCVWLGLLFIISSVFFIKHIKKHIKERRK